MKNLSPELEYKENSTCNYFTENVLSCNAALSSVMGREENVIQNNIQKEYTIDSCVLSPNICSASQKEIACSDQSVFTNHRCIISETVALSYLVSTGSVCGSRNEINARYLKPSSKLSTDTLHIGLFPCEKLCMSENNGGAETRRMVRSASLGHDLNSKEVGRNAGDSVVAVDGCEVSNSENATETESGNDEYVDTSNPRCLKTGVRRGSLPSAMGKLEENCSPCSLAAVLERIPLAYNPQTKQLHIISVTPSSTEVNSNSLHSTDGINSHKENVQNEPGNGHCRESPSKCLTTEEHVEDHLSHLPWKTGVGKPHYDKSESCSGYLSQDKVSVDLSRAPTYGSLQSKTDCCSSFSSISSLSTDFSISTTSPIEDPTNNDNVLKCSSSSGLEHEDPGFIEINLDSQSIRSVDSSCPLNVEQYAVTTASGQGAKPKRLGLPGFLSRNLLSWKSREPGLPDAATGWKLFGKTPQQQAQDKVSVTSKSSDDSSEASRLSSDGCTTPRNRRNQDLVASSTTALILENRPSNLPAKLPEEEIKHRLEYEQMVEAAKKKEMKEAKQKKKLLQQQLRYEEQLCLASKIWNSEILPAWDTMKHSRKSKDLWWQGIPPSVRGKVWKLAIGNDLHITPELYEICVCRAKDRIRMAAESISISEYEVEVTDKEGSVELIKLDVSRTFPQLCIFQKGGPYYDMLHSLLGAYVCYRPDVGYVQGMSFLAAVLILNLDVADAFICFANVLNQPCQLAFFRLDEPMMRSYFLAYEEFFRENLPKLYNHFTKQNLTPDLYLIDWIYTIYSRSLPLDVASRVWDVYFRDGDEFLFRTALGILRLYQDILLNMDFIHLAQFLTKLPEAIAAEPLFKAIGYIRMVIEKRNFSQVLLAHVDTRQT